MEKLLSYTALPKHVWQQTIDAVAAQSHNYRNVHEHAELVPCAKLFGTQLYRIRTEHAGLLASLEIVSWRFR